MNFLREKYARSPEFARIAPFVVWVVFTAMGESKGAGTYWFYAVKTVIGAWMLWEAREFVPEMRWAFSLEAVLVGIAIFGVWVGFEGLYPPLTKIAEGWNPNKFYGQGAAAAWSFIVLRILATTIVVPPLEEIFYRSFLYRYFVKLDFRSMPFNQFHALSFVVTSMIFGFMHPDRWLPGVICGLAFQWLVVRKNRLGDAMTAHAITNFLLGIWVVWKGAWSFW